MALRRCTVADSCSQARGAAAALFETAPVTRDRALVAVAEAVEGGVEEIVEINSAEVAAAPAGRRSVIALTAERIHRGAEALRAVAALPDPLDEVLESREADGLAARRVRVPLGVIGLVLDGRSHLLLASLAATLKSANALVVCTSADAIATQMALCRLAAAAIADCGLPDGAVACLKQTGLEAVRELASDERLVDLIKQRGRDDAAAGVLRQGSVPAILAIEGNCHVYVDDTAPEDTALAVVVASKLSRPGMCHAAEKLLVHRSIAPAFLARALPELRRRGVELRLGTSTYAALGERPAWTREAVERDWDTEYLAPVLAVGVVDSLDAAIAHINRHGSGHAEAIVTGAPAAAGRFQRQVEAAFVCVNVPTSRADGAALGRIGELGNSTQKLPARGPVGIDELCTTQVVIGGPP